jgi:hypothetical protein
MHVKIGKRVRQLDVAVLPGASIILGVHGKILATTPEFATLASLVPVSMVSGWTLLEVNDDDDEEEEEGQDK